MSHRLRGYGPIKGDIPTRAKGSLVSMEQGQVLAYSIDRVQDRGRFFVGPGDKVYKGQVVGEHTRNNDLELNLIKGKKMSNVRSSGNDDAAKVFPKIEFSLEESMEYIKEDEYLEITPESLRMRKI